VLWPYLSIEEHFQIFAMIQGQDEYQKKYHILKELLSLDKGFKYPQILSGGNKRKLCVALNLFSNTDLSFYDEPTVGLDPSTRRNLLELIKQSKSSVLFTTHRLDEAEYICSHIVILKKGSLIFQGSLKDFLKLNSSQQQSQIIVYSHNNTIYRYKSDISLVQSRDDCQIFTINKG